MSAKNYDGAIESYTKAIELDGGNPVFYSNRAAAYSSKNDHLSAIGDAEKAIAIDSAFVKAYHRLGFASPSFSVFIFTDVHSDTRSSAWATTLPQPQHSNVA